MTDAVEEQVEEVSEGVGRVRRPVLVGLIGAGVSRRRLVTSLSGGAAAFRWRLMVLLDGPGGVAAVVGGLIGIAAASGNGGIGFGWILEGGREGGEAPLHFAFLTSGPTCQRAPPVSSTFSFLRAVRSWLGNRGGGSTPPGSRWWPHLCPAAALTHLPLALNPQASPCSKP